MALEARASKLDTSLERLRDQLETAAAVEQQEQEQVIQQERATMRLGAWDI